MPAAQGCAWLAGPAVGWLVAVADRAAAVPGAVVPWPAGPPGRRCSPRCVGRRRAARPLPPASVRCSSRWSSACCWSWCPPGCCVRVGRHRAGPSWRATSGRATRWCSRPAQPGRAVLVDAGPDDGPVDACLDRLGVTALAMVLVSHLHADHVGGLAGALRGRSVGAVAVGPVHEPGGRSTRIRRQSAAAGVRIVEVRPGRPARRGPPSPWTCSARTHPPDHVDPDDGTQVNDGSTVLRATTAAGTVLLTGDVEVAAQATAARRGRAAACGRPEDAAPRQPLQLAGVPRRRRAAGRAGQRRARGTTTTIRTRHCSGAWSARARPCGGRTARATSP